MHTYIYYNFYLVGEPKHINTAIIYVLPCC